MITGNVVVRCDMPDCNVALFVPVQAASDLITSIQSQGWSVVAHKVYCPKCAGRQMPEVDEVSGELVQS